MYLGWNDPSGVLALAKAVSDPHSASYGHYLTPAQFRSRFAPSQAQVTQVRSWLRNAGFSVEYTSQNNHYVSAEGTVAQAAAAFGTSFGMYKVQGLTVRSPSSDISIPSSLAGIVSGVIGLDDSADPMKERRVSSSWRCQGDDGVDGGFERPGAALHLREEESALKRSQKRHGEVVWVDARRQMPGGMQGAQSVANSC